MEMIRNKNRTITYREKVYVNGRSVSKTFKRKSDAITWKKKLQTEKQQMDIWGQSLNSTVLLGEFIKTWLQNKENSNVAPRTMDSYNGVINNYLLPLFASIHLRVISLAHGHKLLTHLHATSLKPVRINFILKIFKQILNDAVRWDYLLKNPLGHLKPIKVPPRHETYWLPSEIQKFLNASQDNELYNLYLVALNSGLRRGELLGLCWDKIDFKNKQIEISRIRDRYSLKETTKTGKIRYVPMNQVVFDTLFKLSLSKLNLQFVFTTNDGQAINLNHLSDRKFQNAITKANVKRIRFHDLRTSYAANFCMQGGDVYALSRILGHTNVEMTTSKYAHLHPSYLRQVADTISFKADSPNLAHSNLKLVEM
ncbi:MAG: hypothetical protein A2381_08590 [Bdellovibrionales bacterium RIFOXYB1_FULL_37_110]|nr:MAG: hypothetical protein A2181_08785 [Bdellovibrionales bacterium RIFOXYA1_FULL_38_20]OFZ51243.1 MAG: hypothetical protein A2417_17570 [Bdellovibrionales bacterium RIFOXYC1_FULL_37_79]OFZ60901.1 MAG: hypothetical protein A2381_08590 [Bdellovibrionales bacterium RIFOXYB1_FULL_37_110]OFZ63645.1 MAG: hypothetical protein A2577_07710 [Bdellovibrionales bacterium RIFOXYD1_FULL_36_51]